MGGGGSGGCRTGGCSAYVGVPEEVGAVMVGVLVGTPGGMGPAGVGAGVGCSALVGASVIVGAAVGPVQTKQVF